MSSKPSDDQLRQAIDGIFDKYDTDRSGTLEANEVFNLINDAFKSLGRNKEVTNAEVNQFITAIDKNSDGKIAKSELFDILKQLLSGIWWWFSYSYKYVKCRKIIWKNNVIFIQSKTKFKMSTTLNNFIFYEFMI